ncbi:MAG: DNA adenine methylase [Deltaproteobacteria bacterium]|nr:DNA adenine methylase [Deltaproteobacteria bacterium]
MSTLSTVRKKSASFGPFSDPARAPAPIVKWVGGKTGLLGQLVPLLPRGVELMRHVEPFMGGGALFFRLQPKRALLCDVNRSLIDTYETVRDDVETVIALLEKLARRHSAENYYAVRTRYNGSTRCSRAERTAMFIYLNKTCFNGLHRVNRKGEFNVPAGRYDKPRIFDSDALRAASRQLAAAELRSESFENLLSSAKPGDFVYFDPPYEPLSDTANFTSYTQSGFSREDQIRLRDVFVALDRRKCKLMLSNSDVPLIRALYQRFRIDRVAALRAINCDGRNRGRISELVVRNYG